MPSSTLYSAETRDPKFVKGTPTTHIAILGCRLLKIICIWFLSDGLSAISTIFPCQREMNEEMDSSDLCL